MLSFDYYNPVEVSFGNGNRLKIGELIFGKYKRILLVCAKGPFRENGLYDEVKLQLEKSGSTVYEMEDIDSNPKLRSVRAGVKIAMENNVDCMVALGGGSAMDCTKLMAVSARTGIDPYEYLWGSRPDAEDSLDTVMVPTIAATGTELNDTAVIVNEKTGEKYWCVCKYPKYCVMDPEITASLPLKMTIWGAMDILSHTFEFYFNGYMDSEFQLCLSEALISSVMNALEVLAKDPMNLTARSELLWCSTMTWGGGLTKIGRGLPDMTCHSIEESFSGHFDTHHGACLGVLTPRWMKLVLSKSPEIFARFARKIMGISSEDDLTAARLGIDAYIAWLRKIGAPQSYRDLSDVIEFSDEELLRVANNAWRIYSGNIGRLYKMSKDDIIDILMQGKSN